MSFWVKSPINHLGSRRVDWLEESASHHFLTCMNIRALKALCASTAKLRLELSFGVWRRHLDATFHDFENDPEGS